MQSVLLQKPHAKSKSKEHTIYLERRLHLWSEGRFQELIKKGKCIQKPPLQSASQTELQKIAKVFNRPRRIIRDL